MTLEEANSLLDRLVNEDINRKSWVEHSKCVGRTARVIAEKLGLDADYVETLGLLHDIGKVKGNIPRHDLDGYEYLTELGAEEKYKAVCITHSFINGDITAVAGALFPNEEFRNEYLSKHTYTLEEEIINLCDLMCTTKTLTVEMRVIEIYIRKGIFEHTQHHLEETMKLKRRIEELLGCNLYILFPNVINESI